MKKRKTIIEENREKEFGNMDTIVIIGNGFDRWQGLDTSYSSFQNYYYKHRDEILERLHLKKHKCIYSEDGTEYTEEYCDVELIYGDPFEPGDLDYDFWNSFEESIGIIDTERLNMFFGKGKSGLREMNRCVRNAKKILTEAFCCWISEIEIDQKNTDYQFGDNCYFINFNYTDTLEKRFGIDPTKIFHIHGEAKDKKSIVFGHNSHPQQPISSLNKLGGRFRGLYYADRLLYETDKQCQENILALIMALSLKGIDYNDIKNIYVLGHSMGKVDMEYFDFLVRSTKISIDTESEKMSEEDDSKCDFGGIDDEFAVIQYIVDTVGYGREPTRESEDAMKRLRQIEQEIKIDEFSKLFFRIMNKHMAEGDETLEAKPRTEDAKWHVAYYDKDLNDKRRKETALNELGCKNFELYSSIDDCIACWKKK